MNSNNNVVVVTGGASGIGLALAQGLLDEGYKVLAIDLLEDRVAAAKKSLQIGEPNRFQAHAADVTDETRIGRIIDQCEQEFGPIAGLVNSAGIAKEIPFLQTDVATFRQILDVNIIGSFIVARAVAQKMMARTTGSIVNIASVSGIRGNYGRVAYGASKGGVNTMTKVMAVELAEMGIRVNAVAPGPIDTPLTKVVHGAEARKNWMDVVPLHRYGEPRELCGTVNWLLDNSKSSYVTGQIISVDGGFTAMGLKTPESTRGQ